MPANDNQRVSPLAWLFLFIAVICDGLKLLLFFLNGLPVIGTVIDAAGSFFISVIEICVVFGGLWFIGLYKGKNGTFNGLLSLGVSTADLVPIVDDIPFTTPTVIYLILEGKISNMLTGAVSGSSKPANDAGDQKAA